MRVIAGVAAAALLLSGCGERPVAPIGVDHVADPVDLVGLWRVRDAGETRSTWLRLDEREMVLWRGSGALVGRWTADEWTILTTVDLHSGAPGGDLAPEWLVGAHRYRMTEDGWQLEDADGDVVATLTVDGAPEPVDPTAERYAEAPEVTDEVRTALAPPAPPPEGTQPATAADVVGRWVPAGLAVETDPHVVLDADGTWRGSDGCNGVGGRWTVSGGRLLALDGPMTLMACPGAPVGSWIVDAAHATRDGEELVLLARDGGELARLARD